MPGQVRYSTVLADTLVEVEESHCLRKCFHVGTNKLREVRNTYGYIVRHPIEQFIDGNWVAVEVRKGE